MWYYQAALLLFVISIAISMSVKISFRKYSKSLTRLTGAQAASLILSSANIHNVSIRQTDGSLTDNYNPSNKTLNLSTDVYTCNSVSAIAVAAHECGHAIQEAEGYTLLFVRKKLVPVANISSNASYFLILLGIMLDQLNICLFGAILFGVIVLFNLVTLPIEIDASNRALEIIKGAGLVEQDQLAGCSTVLRLAGMTYFVSLMSSLLTLLRYISIANSRSHSRRHY